MVDLVCDGLGKQIKIHLYCDQDDDVEKASRAAFIITFIEKNEGCSSMDCYMCGHHFTWHEAESVKKNRSQVGPPEGVHRVSRSLMVMIVIVMILTTCLPVVHWRKCAREAC